MKKSFILTMLLWTVTLMGAAQPKFASKVKKGIFSVNTYDKNGNLKQSQLDKAQSLMNNAGTTFPHIIPTKEMILFFKGVIPGYPTTFFVDQDGRIIDSASGSNDLDGWSERVEKVLSSIE